MATAIRQGHRRGGQDQGRPEGALIVADRSKKNRQAEFGDFQTPPALARQVCEVLARRGLRPASIIEPTCGTGSFLLAALDRFVDAQRAIGIDINEEHLNRVSRELAHKPYALKVSLKHGDFFEADWPETIHGLPEPTLIIGNLPWVTNAALGSLGSSNLPEKSNFQNHRGLDAMTGKSNFDISEWMTLRLLESCGGRDTTIALLCKTAVARKVLTHAWKTGVKLAESEIYSISALDHFGVSVEACLFVCRVSFSTSYDASLYPSLEANAAASAIGYRDHRIIADTSRFERWKHLALPGTSVTHRWRSGIKHDCAPVLELKRVGSAFVNGLGETFDLEEAYVYPMLKSSDIANPKADASTKWMLVTQCSVGDDTHVIKHSAPRTWKYLLNHAGLLDGRASAIYKGRPRFAIFGVGQYSFAPWKVAISGFYKTLNFRAVGPVRDKPVVLDDTGYFLPCENEEEARTVAVLLNGEVAQEFFRAFVFWDAKRPITADLLQRLDLSALARISKTPGLSFIPIQRSLL
jgi:hypothetical protein